jgi:hypothetical protein
MADPIDRAIAAARRRPMLVAGGAAVAGVVALAIFRPIRTEEVAPAENAPATSLPTTATDLFGQRAELYTALQDFAGGGGLLPYPDLDDPPLPGFEPAPLPGFGPPADPVPPPIFGPPPVQPPAQFVDFRDWLVDLVDVLSPEPVAPPIVGPPPEPIAGLPPAPAPIGCGPMPLFTQPPGTTRQCIDGAWRDVPIAGWSPPAPIYQPPPPAPAPAPVSYPAGTVAIYRTPPNSHFRDFSVSGSSVVGIRSTTTGGFGLPCAAPKLYKTTRAFTLADGSRVAAGITFELVRLLGTASWAGHYVSTKAGGATLTPVTATGDAGGARTQVAAASPLAGGLSHPGAGARRLAITRAPTLAAYRDGRQVRIPAGLELPVAKGSRGGEITHVIVAGPFAGAHLSRHSPTYATFGARDLAAAR